MTALLLVAGLVLLVLGAEGLVRGASKLAAAAGISPLVVGLTIVAYGTSMPEMAVSTTSGLAGHTEVALGNVIGSNIFNVLFILGISALVTPLVVSQQLIRLDVPLMVGVSFLILAFSADGRVGRLEGLVLFAGMLCYTTALIAMSRRQSRAQRESRRAEGRGFSTREAVQNAGLVLGGLLLLVLGSQWLVKGAVAIAGALGVSELIIGLTIVAIGTSLPEVATSVVAALRGERDIAVGNVIGSNLFNLLGVLGLTAAIVPGGIAVPAAVFRFDLPVMVAVAAACLPIFFTGHLVARWEGAVFLGYYAAYTLYLILAALRSPSLPALVSAMWWFVLPLTALTLVVTTFRSLRQRKQA